MYGNLKLDFLRDFHTHSEKLLPKYLDSMNNVLHDAILNPIQKKIK